MRRRLLLRIAYDGTGFSGWQRQPDVRTVQGELERCLAEMEGEPIRLFGASRTDAGVHALGQVASFSSRHAIPMHGYVAGLNALLGPDVAVLEARPAPDRFDIRRWPSRKLYRYTFYEAEVRDPFWDRYAVRVPGRLDVEAMRQAAEHLLGTHDFSAFKAADPARKNPVRTVDAIRILRDGNVVTMDVTGRSFLKYMVRNIAGTLLEVGTGKRTPASVRQALESRDRAQAGPTAPARGLCLVHVALAAVSWESAGRDAIWPRVAGPTIQGLPEPVSLEELEGTEPAGRAGR